MLYTVCQLLRAQACINRYTVSEDKVSFTVTIVMMCFVTRRDDGMWNAGWNEVIWPNASFRLRPQETVQHCLFPLHHISFFPSLLHTKAHTHTQIQTINLVILPRLTSGTSLESDNRVKVKEFHIPEQSTSEKEHFSLCTSQSDLVCFCLLDVTTRRQCDSQHDVL